MPLVVVCGIPGSGKTKRAIELANFLTQTHKCKVVLINEESLGIDKSEGYRGKS
jgi:tRNA uridine 5-carbamoylmethylation protein Kti12